jgi:putative ABC transport system permease protein
MGMRLLEGRALGEQDRGQSPGVLVVNRTMARRYFPDGGVVGKQITLAGIKTPFTVVGVVGDVRELDVETEARPAMYIPAEQGAAQRTLSVVVRHSGQPDAVASAMRREVAALDKELPVAGLRGMNEVVSQSLAQPRFTTALLAVFAAIALLLAATGIYGVMSYTVAQRTHEFGVRMALGARGLDVLRLVVGRGMALVLSGVGLGLVAAFALTRVMSSLLYGVSATDPLTFAGVALILVAAALLACLVPARRATRVDPMVALRHE